MNTIDSKFIFSTCSDSPANATYIKIMFSKMSGQQSERNFQKVSVLQDVRAHKRRQRTQIFFLQMSGHTSQKVYFLIHVRTHFRHVWTPTPRNSFQPYFRVFRAYLKWLLGSVSLRIPAENFIVLREGF